MMTSRWMLAGVLLTAGCLARRTHPEPSPEGAYTVLELKAPVSVQIDAFGVPHIDAQSEHDALAGMGFVHARDRGFQMELIRLASQGRLSEVLGADMLDADRRMRLLSWRVDAQLANLSPESAALLSAYCAGANRGYAETPRPLELKLLKHTPAPWTPRDILTVARLQAWQQAADIHRESVGARVQVALDDEATAWFLQKSPVLGAAITDPDPSAWPALDLRPPPEGVPAITAPVSARDDKKALLPPATPRDVLVRAQALLAAYEGTIGGSNAFAVSGERTRSGQPILAGDPHLALSWPPVFYEVSVKTPDWVATGGSIPGLPAVLLGFSDRAAWSLTVSYADSQNLLRLETEGSRYKVGRRWEEMTPWPQTFLVKDGDAVTEDYQITAHGPVYGAGRDGQLPVGETYALQWPLLRETGGDQLLRFPALYTAETGEQVAEAIAELDFAAMSWVFATRSGDIGYARGGEMAAPGSQHLPVDAGGHAAGQPEPTVVINPEQGWVVSTNQPIRSDQALTHYSSGTMRALRAMTVLDSRTDWTHDALRGLQLDATNVEAALTVPGMLKVVGRPRGLEAEMVSVLSRWDFGMDGGAAAPLIYEAWRGALHRRLLASHITDVDLREDYLRARLSEGALLSALTRDEGQKWWDDPRTPPVETREQAIRAGLAEAARELSDLFGNNIEKWRWDAALVWTPSHPFASKALLRPIFGEDPVPLSGGRHTLNNYDHSAVVNDFEVGYGPAMRFVVTPGGDASYVLAGGNAGQPGHPFSGNQVTDWVRNRQHTAGSPSGEGGGFRLEP